ncbi:MAG: hypothetical protein JXR70_03055 [Spirochaetales bacterium]|nr:hypothetical protein [Spirochaetales bacterium]
MNRPGKMDLLNRIYDRDPLSGAYIIQVSIDRYTDIFNELDPSPLRKRDLDADFVNYIEDFSIDIPLKYKTELQVVGPREIRDVEKEKRVQAGIKTYCNYMLLVLREKLYSAYRNAIGYTAVFLLLMLISFTLGPLLQNTVFSQTLLEGISVGSWVFLWEAIALLSFKNLETRREFKRYQRLELSPVKFLYR